MSTTVKTAVSIPRATFEELEARAGEQGLSRSAFVTRALDEYLRQLRNDDLRRRLDEAYGEPGTPEEEDEDRRWLEFTRRQQALFAMREDNGE